MKQEQSEDLVGGRRVTHPSIEQWKGQGAGGQSPHRSRTPSLLEKTEQGRGMAEKGCRVRVGGCLAWVGGEIWGKEHDSWR